VTPPTAAAPHSCSISLTPLLVLAVVMSARDRPQVGHFCFGNDPEETWGLTVSDTVMVCRPVSSGSIHECE